MHRAFTLVEILIVVVILGILAAIVIPQFTNASEEANASSTKSQLQTIRSQIELYRVKNQGDLPVTSGLLDWSLMITGKYLQQEPINPMTGSSTVSDTASSSIGWVWDNTNEQIYAVDKDGNQLTW
ncbi:MAG: prepilin-type N-terminal cleavage/methylation domain-containing protein [Planctomycetes bacterium]|nr:prepilin-type N-terminal cleavage/methylation domain-containing protein [Planctomycetota bacterium]NOG54118.1 prepilin-type N-terminal cleavage/methylation domain-containing protein [Planctomycetota bacterium]